MNSKRFRILPQRFKIVLVFAILASNFGRASGFSLQDGYGQMYNLEFDAAHQTFQNWQRENPADPLGPVSDAAAYLFSEFDRLHILQAEFFENDSNFDRSRRLTPDPAIKTQFEASLRRASQLADAKLAKSPNDPDAAFANVLVHGLRSDYLGLIERNLLSSFSEVKQGRIFADHLLNAHPDYYDAYVAIGVENYMLGLKSAPVRWLLRMGGGQTDKQLGIEKMRLAAEHGRYLLPFARLLLAVAALRDKDMLHAREYLGWLATKFPENRLYREELSKIN
jgi:hypothetical protein